MSDDIVRMTPAVQSSAGIGIALLIVIAFVGNGMTLVAYARSKTLHTVYNFYIVNLAATDFLISSLSMPFYAVYTLLEFTWPFGYGFCKVWSVIDYTLCFESIAAMLVLSLDRLMLLYLGPHYSSKITMKVAIIIVAISWLVSFLVYGPAIIGWNHWVGYSTVEDMDCDVEFAYDFPFTTATAIIEFALPFVLLTSLNSVIYFKIRSRNKVAPANAASTNGHQTSSNQSAAPPKETAEKGESASQPKNTSSSSDANAEAKNAINKSKSRQDAKAAKLLAVLVCTFLLFWAPYSFTTVVISFCDTCINYSLYEFFVWVLWMKCAVNPFLYAHNSLQYRASFRQLLGIITRRRRRMSVSTVQTSVQ